MRGGPVRACGQLSGGRGTGRRGGAWCSMAAMRTRTRTRPGLVARHRRGGHAVVVGRAHGDGGHGLRPAARPAHHGRRRRPGRRSGRVGVLDAPAPEPVAGARRRHRRERDAEPSPRPRPKPSSRPRGRAPPSDAPAPGRHSGRGQELRHRRRPGRLRPRRRLRGPGVGDAGAGWSMQVWKTETWIRVDFTAGADRVSVFCTWHDGAAAGGDRRPLTGLHGVADRVRTCAGRRPEC